MNTNYEYTTVARWTTGRGGIMKAESIEQPIQFSSPPEFLGQAGLWTPEHFLVAAVAGCFVSTFAAMAEMSKLEVLYVRGFRHWIVGKDRRRSAVQSRGDSSRRWSSIANRIKNAHSGSWRKRSVGCLIARSLRSEVVLEPVCWFSLLFPPPSARVPSVGAFRP